MTDPEYAIKRAKIRAGGDRPEGYVHPLTRAQRAELFTAQEGVCACCRRERPRLVADHCHRTNLVRSLVCDQCNSLIGRAEWEPPVLVLAYIAAHAACPTK